MKGCDELLGIQDTLKALADPTRREILNLLKNGRLSAGEICAHFSVSSKSHVVLDLPVLLMYPVYPKIHHTPLFNI